MTKLAGAGLAMIAARVGEKDLACEQLESIIQLPSPLSYGGLKLFPWWDPLRDDPRFEKIVASLAPNVTLPVTVGVPITWSATVTGGVPPRQYAFYLFNGNAGTWSLLQAYSASASAT